MFLIIVKAAIGLCGWLLIGHIFWRTIYYGALKYWYIEHNIDYTNSKASKVWRESMPQITAGGIINFIPLILLPYVRRISFKYGITLYFKPPADAYEIEQ